MKKVNIDRFYRTQLGLKIDSKNNFAQGELNMKGKPSSKPEEDNLPKSFTWTDIKNTKCPISHIRDQSNCGSCWVRDDNNQLIINFLMSDGHHWT